MERGSDSPVERTGTATGAVEVRPATADELDTAAGVLEDALRWAAARGFESWPAGTFHDPHGWGRTVLRHALEVDGLFLVERSGRAVATLSLFPEDEVFWPGAGPDGLYLHRFAVRRSASGTGVGAEALAWCEAEVRRRGRRFLRLDCVAENPGIRRYYETAGFEHRGDMVVNELGFSLYEKRVG
ncbi:MAG TPA: GNAT family N-acetyltransferase [Actinomycetota bacterium]|nr:GNAT family N-acetyltransferase [Actinomycetota bacterium]